MRFLYGISSSTANDYSNATMETLEFARQHEFDVIEIYCETPDFIPGKVSSELLNKVHQLALDNNIRVQLHAPFHSINLASFNDRVRQLSIRILEETMELAQRLESPIVTFHLGLCFLPCQLYRNKAFDFLIDSLNQVLDYASNYGIIIAMENRGGKLDIGKPSDLLRVANAIDNKLLKITFDTVQANVHGDPIEYYLMLKDHVINVHVSDSPRGKSLLLAVGEGEINFKGLMKAFIDNSFNGPLIFEMSSKDKALISRNVLQEIVKEILS